MLQQCSKPHLFHDLLWQKWLKGARTALSLEEGPSYLGQTAANGRRPTCDNSRKQLPAGCPQVFIEEFRSLQTHSGWHALVVALIPRGYSRQDGPAPLSTTRLPFQRLNPGNMVQGCERGLLLSALASIAETCTSLWYSTCKARRSKGE